MVHGDRTHLLDVVLEILDADLADADAHDEAAVRQFVNGSSFGGQRGRVTDIRRGNTQADGNCLGGSGNNGERGKATASFQPVLPEPVVGLRDPEAASHIGGLGLRGIGANRRQRFIRLENHAHLGLYCLGHLACSRKKGLLLTKLIESIAFTLIELSRILIAQPGEVLPARAGGIDQ